MGGFHISTRAIKPGPSFRDGTIVPDSVPLTPEGFLKFVELDGGGELSYIKDSHCNERSKASMFQKSLVFIQVSWMAIQCFMRLGCKLPITLLEVHTLVHIFFALILGIIWLKVSLSFSGSRSWHRNAS